MDRFTLGAGGAFTLFLLEPDSPETSNPHDLQIDMDRKTTGLVFRT